MINVKLLKKVELFLRLAQQMQPMTDAEFQLAQQQQQQHGPASAPKLQPMTDAEFQLAKQKQEHGPVSHDMTDAEFQLLKQTGEIKNILQTAKNIKIKPDPIKPLTEAGLQLFINNLKSKLG